MKFLWREWSCGFMVTGGGLEGNEFFGMVRVGTKKLSQ
jgi:hypothetical protein